MLRPLSCSLIALALTLTGCDEQPTQGARGDLEWTSQEQVHRAPATTTTQMPSQGPKESLEQFFNALRGGQPAEAAAWVARRPLEVSEAQLLESLKQWGGEVSAAQQEFVILDSQQTGDFALVRTWFRNPDAPEADQAMVRPVVLFREEGRWKVVWELIGKQPDQVASFNPSAAQRLQPLYSWYEERQLYSRQDAQRALQQQDDAQAAQPQAPEG